MKRYKAPEFKEVLKKIVKAWPYFLVFAAIVLLDQWSKVVVANAAGSSGGTIHVAWVIKDFIEIAYCENTAGAMALFSALDEHARYVIFMVITVLILVGLSVYLLLSGKKKSIWLKIAVAFVYAGAIGNFIDRLIEVYVRDFIHVIINIGGREWFPYIFNVADSFLVIAVIMIIIHVLFLDSEAVFKKQDKPASEDIVAEEAAPSADIVADEEVSGADMAAEESESEVKNEETDDNGN